MYERLEKLNKRLNHIEMWPSGVWFQEAKIINRIGIVHQILNLKMIKGLYAGCILFQIVEMNSALMLKGRRNVMQ